MTNHDAMKTALECRKLSSYYRTRNSDAPLTDQERMGLANLLSGVADLVQAVSLNAAPDQGNVVTMAKVKAIG